MAFVNEFGVQREWARPPRPGVEFQAPWHLLHDGAEPYCNGPSVRAHFGWSRLEWPPTDAWERWAPKAGLKRTPRAPHHHTACPFCTGVWQRARAEGLV